MNNTYLPLFNLNSSPLYPLSFAQPFPACVLPLLTANPQHSVLSFTLPLTFLILLPWPPVAIQSIFPTQSFPNLSSSFS